MKRSLAVHTSCVAAALAIPAAALAGAGSEPPGSGPGDGAAPGAELDIEFQIDMMLGLVPQDEVEEYYHQRNVDEQRLVQECMNEAGFEYEPEIWDSGEFVDPREGISDLEWAQQWGFEVYTTMDPETSPWNDVGPVTEEWPNQGIVDAMSTAEQNAWFETQTRCMRDSSMSMQSDPFRNPMVQQAMEDFQTMVDDDPRSREAMSAWQDCMDAAGHPYTDPESMWNDWYDADKQEQFWQSEAWNPSSPDHAEWQQLVDEEIEVAVASAGCTPAWEEAMEEIRQDLRPQLVELWQDVDWSLPPVTYPGEWDWVDEGGAVEELPLDSMVPAPDGSAPGDAGALDLGGSDGLDLGTSSSQP